MYPLETSNTLKVVSAHIKVTDGAGEPGARKVTDGARVWMDIATKGADPGLGDVERESGQLEEEPPSCDRSTSRPAKKTVLDNGGDLLVKPLGRSVLPFRPIHH